jgi:hypothetical protein
VCESLYCRGDCPFLPTNRIVTGHLAETENVRATRVTLRS